MMVCVLTTDLTLGDESFRVIDHSSHEQRKWLAKHVVWALHNNKAVKTWRQDAADAPYVSDFDHLPRDPRRA